MESNGIIYETNLDTPIEVVKTISDRAIQKN